MTGFSKKLSASRPFKHVFLVFLGASRPFKYFLVFWGAPKGQHDYLCFWALRAHLNIFVIVVGCFALVFFRALCALLYNLKILKKTIGSRCETGTYGL